MADKAKWKALEEILSKWREIKLTEWQDEMDKTALEISEHKEANSASRKGLQEKTKEFQKLSDEDLKRKEMGPLIKLYQKEIDAITKRAKYSDHNFLELYKLLREAPDPVPPIAGIVDSKHELGNNKALNEEVQTLRNKLSEYETEFRDLKNQEVTIENLRLQVQQYEEQLHKGITQGIEAQREQDNLKQLGLLESLRENESRLQHQVEQQNEGARRALAEHESAQQVIMKLTAALDEARAQKESVDLVLQNEIDILSGKVEMLELENSQLRLSVQEKPAALAHDDDMLDALQVPLPLVRLAAPIAHTHPPQWGAVMLSTTDRTPRDPQSFCIELGV